MEVIYDMCLGYAFIFFATSAMDNGDEPGMTS